MSTHNTPLAALFAAHSARRREVAELRRVERELSSFVSESEKAELSAILERNADDQAVEIHDLITERVLAATEHHAA